MFNIRAKYMKQYCKNSCPASRPNTISVVKVFSNAKAHNGVYINEVQFVIEYPRYSITQLK